MRIAECLICGRKILIWHGYEFGHKGPHGITYYKERKST
jgi:hypothetical protein